MHEKIGVIEQNPLALIVSLNARRELAVLLQLQADLVRDGLILARTRARANYEMVGEAGDSGEVQNREIRRFLCLRRANRDLPSMFGSLGMNFCTSTFSVAGIDMRQKLAPTAIVL